MPDSTAPIAVLHVDDEPDFADLTATSLEREADRFTVETATDTETGLERLREGTFDCVVSDYDMPGLDGIDFLEAVRAEAPERPFILFTGKGSEEVASEAISAGVTDYLQKAIGTSQFAILANRIEKAVAQRRARAAAVDTERRLQTIANNTNDILWMFSGDWDELKFINAAYEEIWGGSVDELHEAPRSFLERIHPDDRDRVCEAMADLSAGEPVDIEYRVNPDEDYGRWVWVQGQPILEEEGSSVEWVVGFARDVTERKTREERLQLMEQLVHAMNDGAVIAQDGVIEYANPRVTELTGHPIDDLVGRRMETFIAPTHRETVADRHRARLAGDEAPPPVYEIEVLGADGTPIPVEISVSRIDFGGEPATLSLVRDITERKRRDRERRRLKQEYETVYETAQDAIFLLDVVYNDGEPAFEFRRLNPAHEAISGLSSEAIRGQTPQEVLGDELGAEVAENYHRCAEAEAPIAYNEVLEMPAKTVHWHTKLGPVMTDGQVTQIVGVARDVTEQRARERELERYETIIEASGDPMYTLDADGHFTFVNDALLELVGYDESALLGTHAEIVLDAVDVERGEELIRSLLAEGGGRGTFEMTLYTADGEAIPCENHMALLPFDEAFRGTVGVLRDITDRVERERRLQAERDRLDEFASVVSHDLKGPLNVATGQLALAREETANDHLEAVAAAHNRMGGLIDDLLVLARHGRDPDEVEPVDLSSVADRCWASVPTDGASLAVESEPTVRADPVQLRQLLENLFRNAVEHGGETVTVAEHDAGFYVADDGPGISPDDRERVFEAGYSTADGTGFGLRIVHEIAEAHGWEVAVSESTEGGARFEVTGVDGE
mgnify:CR=1 FL=1